jgi:glycopeptide antibiotics resistance protein
MGFSVANLFLQSAVNTFGSVAIAGKTAALDITTLTLQGINAGYTSCVSFAGQCFGAKKYDRVDQVWKKSLVLCISYVVITGLICTLFYLGGLLYADRKNNRKVMRILMWLFFGLYLYLLLNFTLLDKGMGRNALIPESIEGGREYYVNRFVNLKPFQSIYDVYIQGFLNGYVNSYYMLLNLLGNTCAFMPLSFFLPHFWRGQRRWYVFLPTLTVSVAVVEALQFAFMVGCCDVDDLILNVGGAMILYFFFRIPLLSRALKVFANGGTWKETE